MTFILAMPFRKNPYQPNDHPLPPNFETASVEFFQPTFNKKETDIAGGAGSGVPKLSKVFGKSCFVFHFVKVFRQLLTSNSIDFTIYLGRTLIVARLQSRRDRFCDRAFPNQQTRFALVCPS